MSSEAREKTLQVTRVSCATRTSRKMEWNVIGVFAGSTVSVLELLMMNTQYCLIVPPRLCFFCSLCYRKVPFALKVKDEVINSHEALQTNLQSIDSKLSELHSITEAAKNLGTQIEKHQKTFAEALADHPADTPMRSAPPLLSEDSVAHLTVSLAVEQKEKEKRQLNIV